MSQVLIDEKILLMYREGNPEVRKALEKIYGVSVFGQFDFQEGLRWLVSNNKDAIIKCANGEVQYKSYPIHVGNTIVNIEVAISLDKEATEDLQKNGIGKYGVAATSVHDLFKL